MQTTIYVKEATDIIKKLSPENQVYMLTLARVAMTAENAIKDSSFMNENKNKPNSTNRR